MTRRLQCQVCNQVSDSPEQHPSCPRCGAKLSHRRRGGLRRSQAFALAAAILLVPANLLPVMTIEVLGRGSPSTILSGVISLCAEGMWAIGLIVLVASFVVPLVKLGGLAVLFAAARGRFRDHRRELAVLYRVIAVIGRWSMLDVFLVVFLTGLVQLGILASVTPGLGIVAFGGSVVLTLLATDAFDPRFIWDDPPAHADFFSSHEYASRS